MRLAGSYSKRLDLVEQEVRPAKSLHIFGNGQVDMDFRGISGAGGLHCFTKTKTKPILVKLVLPEPEETATDVFIAGQPIDKFGGTPPDELHFHASVLRPSLPLAEMFIPAIHLRLSVRHTSVGAVSGNADVVANQLGVLVERRLDRIIDLPPLSAREGRREILGLPSPLMSFREDTIALHACIGRALSNEMRCCRSIVSGKLGAQFLESTRLRVVQ